MPIDVYGRQVNPHADTQGEVDIYGRSKGLNLISTAQADETEDSAALQSAIRDRRAAEAAE